MGLTAVANCHEVAHTQAQVQVLCVFLMFAEGSIGFIPLKVAQSTAADKQCVVCSSFMLSLACLLAMHLNVQTSHLR